MGNGNQSLEEVCITLNKSVTKDQLLLVNTDCMVISLLNMVDLTAKVAGKVKRDKAGVVVGTLGMERDYVEDQNCAPCPNLLIVHQLLVKIVLP